MAAAYAALEERYAEMLEKCYRVNVGLMLRGVTEKLRFAERKRVSTLLNECVEELLGPPTDHRHEQR